ncbi:MAG: type II toxin-antitoxin system RelE/ParE family toxin [Bacteroidia bacterium]
MEVVYERAFLKDIKKLKDPKTSRLLGTTLTKVEYAVENWPVDGGVPVMPGLEKLKGFDQFYRIRVGDYRIGISIEISEEEQFFRIVRFLHRKEVYRYFP